VTQGAEPISKVVRCVWSAPFRQQKRQVASWGHVDDPSQVWYNRQRHDDGFSVAVLVLGEVQPGISSDALPSRSNNVGLPLAGYDLATMSLEQVELPERHVELLESYSHLLEVYLDPERFLDLTGLNENEKAGKIGSTRKLAPGVLPPNEKDTLTGVIKTVTNRLQQIVTLKRTVVGLDGMMTTTNRSHSSDPLAGDGVGRRSTSSRSPSGSCVMCER
jgi:hypothetical protein